MLVAIPLDDGQSDSPLFGIRIPEHLCLPWHSFNPSEIQPCEDNDATDPPSAMPSKVLLRDETMAFLKLMRPGDRGFLQNELDAYTKIRDANLDKSLRIPRLLGLVRDKDGQVLALLLTYIDCQRRTLSCASKPGTSKSMRRKWMEQIEDAVAQLHHAGISWGDAKSDNVLIDQRNDAWLIDLGGSYTEGWVPKAYAGTVEGDRIALGKIKESLEIN